VSDINFQLTREYFELNYFRVMTPWQRRAHEGHGGDDGAQLFVDQAEPVIDDEAGLLLTGGAVKSITRAVVEIRAWHSDRVYASDVEAHAVLCQFAQDGALEPARDYFRGEAFATILVISELPATEKARADALAAIQSRGVDHVIEFSELLRGLLERIDLSAVYGPSPTLHLLQLLKRYRLTRNSQLEFTFPFEPAVLPEERNVETVEESAEQSEG